MAQKSITLLLPAAGTIPSGGYKVAYEYANRLCRDGYLVHIAYPALRFADKQPLKRVIRMWLKCFYYRYVKGYSCKVWFPLDDRIREHYFYSLNYRYIPKTEFYLATAVQTAISLASYPISNKRKLYLIQDFENWELPDDQVKETYRYGFKNIVVSTWLERIVLTSGANCVTIKNGFDFEYFKMYIPPSDRNRFHIAMMYSYEPRKGCKFGLAALEKVKQTYPELKVSLFGVQERPLDIPDYFEYSHRPDRDTHNRIYNEAAIYLAPSIDEGWGLPVGEAMICGCAVVCTDNKGFREMAEDGVTALMSPARDPQSLAHNIIRLIEDDILRVRIATQGNANIHQFSWDISYAKLKNLL